MESGDIISFFEDLGDEIEQRGFKEPVRILIVGGAYMALAVASRRSTEDVDVVLMDMPDTTNKTRETKAFRSAVNAVAKKRRLKRHWLNDDVAYFIRDMAPDPQPTLWHKFKRLHVYFPDIRYILALKLMVFREKDRGDVEALLQKLQITTREQAQAIADRFVPDKEWQAHYLLDNTLDELF